MPLSHCETRFRRSESLARSLHDPVRRRELERLGQWSIRSEDWQAPQSREALRAGTFHVQLWNAQKGISVLTPSSLTKDHYEIYLGCGCRHRISCLQGVEMFLKVCQETDFPALASWGCYVVPPTS